MVHGTAADKKNTEIALLLKLPDLLPEKTLARIFAFRPVKPDPVTFDFGKVFDRLDIAVVTNPVDIDFILELWVK